MANNRRKNGNAAEAGATAPGLRSKSASTWLMLLTTVVLLPLVFPPFYCWFLAPIAIAPLCICILRRPMTPRYLSLYYLAGLGFFLPNLFWLGPVTWIGFVLVAMYLAIYFPLFAFILRRLVNDLRMPASFAVPLAWTMVEYVRCTFLEGGFPWFMLGNCFARFPLLIQIADLFGVWGVTLLIALLNGLAVDILRLPLKREGKFNLGLGRLIATGAVLVAFTIVYGVVRLGENTFSIGPRVAVIQDNIPQSVKDKPESALMMLQDHYKLTVDAASANPPPDLIAWPETMVPGFMNPELLETSDEFIKQITNEDFRKFVESRREDGRFCRDLLTKLANRYQVSLLLGIGSLEPRTSMDDSIKQNRTTLLLPGAGPGESYSKVHLVPFGEYIPFRSFPLVGKYMVNISPYGFDYSNIPGREWTRYHLPVSQTREVADTEPVTTTATAPYTIIRNTRVFTFATPICFEDAMPEPAQMMVNPQFAPQSSVKKTDFLINVSNDGWFYSAELDQRLQASQLRAVENRVPMVRAVNTGNSGFIDSCGRLRKIIPIGAVDTAADTLMLDSRVTLYSSLGDVLPIFCGIVCVLGVGFTFIRPRREGNQNP